MRYLLAITILCVLTLVFFWQPDSKLAFWQDGLSKSDISQTRITSSESNSKTATSQTDSEKYLSAPIGDKRDNITEEFTPNPKTVASLRQGRLEGDSRAPNLAPNHEREKPTEDELDDHEQYVEYERRQQKRVFRAYVEASKVKTAQLRSMIERGKTEGVSAEEIAFAEEKIRGIEEMAAELQQNYPDIMEDSYQPPADWLIENLGKEDESHQTDASNNN